MPTKSFCLRYWISNKNWNKKNEKKNVEYFFVSLFADMIYSESLAELIAWSLKWFNGE